MNKVIHLIILMSLPLAVHATFSGNYKYSNYDIFFTSQTNIPSSTAKRVFFEDSDYSISALNTFSTTTFEYTLNRIITDHWVEGSEGQYFNQYVSYLDWGTAPVPISYAGTIQSESNLVMNVLSDRLNASFAFNTGTNVAISIQNSEAEHDTPAYGGIGLLVRKGTGLNLASLNGNYARFEIEHGAYGETPYGRGRIDKYSILQTTISFDGSGSFSETGTYRAFERRVSDNILTNGSDSFVDSNFDLLNQEVFPHSDSGTYALDANGSLSLDGWLTQIYGAQVSPDANLFMSAYGIAAVNSSATYLTAAVKQPDNMPTNGISAVYYIVELEESYTGDSVTAGTNENVLEANRTYVFLNSDNTFKLRNDNWTSINQIENLRYDTSTNGTPNIVSVNNPTTTADDRATGLHRGTYTIATNGIVTLNYDNGETAQAQLSANGEYLVMGGVQLSSDPTAISISFGVGVKRALPDQVTLPIELTDTTISPTGLVITATVPGETPIEGLYSTDLTSGEWFSIGTYTSTTGTITMVDPSVTNDNVTSGFYSSTFVPW